MALLLLLGKRKNRKKRVMVLELTKEKGCLVVGWRWSWWVWGAGEIEKRGRDRRLKMVLADSRRPHEIGMAGDGQDEQRWCMMCLGAHRKFCCH
jgi:hypothetical protein